MKHNINRGLSGTIRDFMEWAAENDLDEVLSEVKGVRIADIASYIYLQSRDRNSHSLRSQSSVEI